MPFRDAWLLIGGLLVLVGFGAAEPAISGTGFVVILVGGVGRYWGRRLFDGVHLRRTLGERRAFAGEEVPLRVDLENRKFLPLPWFEWRLGIADPLPVEGESLAAAVVPGRSWIVRRGALGWWERRTWAFTLRPAERGYHGVGPASIRSADLLGLFPRTLDDPAEDHLTVFPRVFSLRDLGLPADRPFGERKGSNRLYEDPLRIAGLRDYRPGDPMRRIDWKATARRGDLQSRVYDPSATQQLYIMLNIDTMEHSWEGYLKDELERAVSVAASVAVWASGERFAVGLLANGAYPNADRPIRLAPSRSREQLTRILEALAVVQPLTTGDLAGAIKREAGRFQAGSTMVVVASLMPAPLAGVVTRLHDEGHRVHVLATSGRVDPSKLGPVPVENVGRAFERDGALL
ncbi:MAG: DUF58 domain-containing protein [Dehalococcoidia bacterium]|nr:DUF58 domain-containing protein [Dehalococcoidia bacterium]NUQ56041.1 DUF58 domain-containing protein [Dehalococcoidia bacterium]